MGIDLTWTDSNGSPLDSVGDPECHMADAVIRVREDRTSPFSMLKSIDPYGTTRFAPPQVATLLRELQTVRDATADPAASITLGKFLSVIRAAEGAQGTWLEFDGD